MRKKKNRLCKINFSNIRAQFKPGVYEIINAVEDEMCHYILNIESNFYLSLYNHSYPNSRCKSYELAFFGEIIYYRGTYNLIYPEQQYCKKVLCNYIFFTTGDVRIRKLTSPE
jgi:hypothetical protein